MARSTWGDDPPSPGTRRAQVAAVLADTSMMLASDRPERREEGLEILEPSPEQADNEVEQDRRIAEIARSAGFTKLESKKLGHWVAQRRARVQDMRPSARRVEPARPNRDP